MKELQLHQVWKAGMFDHRHMRTTSGLDLEIIDRGMYNLDSGPDFTNARLRIGGIEWIGNVELHIKASDWLKHGHNNDPAYLNTILHVVLIHDTDIALAGGVTLAAFELNNRIPDSMYGLLGGLESFSAMPCRQYLIANNNLPWGTMLHSGLERRISELSERLISQLKICNGNWNEAMHKILFRAMGLRVNAEPMEQMFAGIPLKLLIKQPDSPFFFEALLLGQSGLIPVKVPDHYTHQLQKAYQYHRIKYNLQPMSAGSWKWMRMRPGSFPHMRLARLAAFLLSGGNWVSDLREAQSPAEVLQILRRGSLSAYWQNHRRFGVSGESMNAEMPDTLLTTLAVNVVVPFYGALGQINHRSRYRKLAEELLEAMPAEDNRITREMKKCGVPNQNAAQSQAIIGLRRHYCEAGKCLECEIGLRIISR